MSEQHFGVQTCCLNAGMGQSLSTLRQKLA
jgi:hypothetical protein